MILIQANLMNNEIDLAGFTKTDVDNMIDALCIC